MTDYSKKSTVAEIKARFDQDVERFSNLQTGQQTTLDAPLCMELVTGAAQKVNPSGQNVLDVGCGAGNYTLKLLEKIPNMHCTLIDLSQPMLDKAQERVGAKTAGEVKPIQGDIRDIALPENYFDVIMAASVLHHLRGDEDWKQVFQKLHRSLKKGGSLWIFDLITHDQQAVEQLFAQQYGEYLEALGGVAFREKVQAYIEKEDTPRSLMYQLNLLSNTGFKGIEILHKRSNFAAFGGIK